MRSYIELENMKFFAHHGVLKQEKKIGNEYLVTHINVEIIPGGCES